ncbi:MAG TPA: hypothetical protein VHM16_02690, partial [Rubrobacteraceae bacterium]|nr:hypothetical protein [Rubrobacteraceae bacterium]
MESREQNYGVTGEPEAAKQEPIEEAPRDTDYVDQDRTGYRSLESEALGSGAAVMSPKEEKTWSVLSHLSVFLNIFTL